MNKIKRFNENNNYNVALSMDDVRHINHNLDYKEKGDFMSNYSWDESQKLQVKNVQASGMWDGKKVVIYGLYDIHEFGYAITIDGEIKYLVGIYEPHGCNINEKRGLITCYGHEDIIQLWLDDGEFATIYTR